MNLDPDESDDDDNNTNNPSKAHVHTRNSGGVDPHPLRGSTPSVEDRISEQSSVPPPAVSITLETDVDNTAVYQIVIHLMNRITKRPTLLLNVKLGGPATFPSDTILGGTPTYPPIETRYVM